MTLLSRHKYDGSPVVGVPRVKNATSAVNERQAIESAGAIGKKTLPDSCDESPTALRNG